MRICLRTCPYAWPFCSARACESANEIGASFVPPPCGRPPGSRWTKRRVHFLHRLVQWVQVALLWNRYRVEHTRVSAWEATTSIARMREERALFTEGRMTSTQRLSASETVGTSVACAGRMRGTPVGCRYVRLSSSANGAKLVGNCPVDGRVSSPTCLSCMGESAQTYMQALRLTSVREKQRFKDFLRRQ